MKLGTLMVDLVPRLTSAIASIDINGVQDDSRRVKPGDLFIAMSGLTVDGHKFIPDAIKAGALAVVADREIETSVPCFVVENPACALAIIAARFQGLPADQLKLIGVTGTNGKTTTTYLIEAILSAAGHRPGIIGTVTYRYAGHSEPAPFTTPTPLVMQSILRKMVDQGCSHVVSEVSSHALQLGRVWGLDFAVAGFTHLTQDHLDLHGTMVSYLEAKGLLFSQHLRSGGTAVINMDGDGAQRILEIVKNRGDVHSLRCSTQGKPAEAQLKNLVHSVSGISAQLKILDEEIDISSPLLGAYNADNILMASSCCSALGISLNDIARGIREIQGVPGRLERVDHDGPFAVLVDYAHTPDALMRAINVIRPLCRGRLLVVFGCGGDRDRTKRPLMGEAVARGADLAIITSDNPRTEDPLAIIEEILVGIRAISIPLLAEMNREKGYWVEPDRRTAIYQTIKAARPGDIVLIAGKGHEDYQILGKQKIHFDDREEAQKALVNR